MGSRIFTMLLVIAFCCLNTVYGKAAVKKDLIVHWQHIDIQDALQILAKFFHQNIVISPEVHGITSLYLRNTSKQEAFHLVFISHDLVKQQIGNVWFIAPRGEMNKRFEEDSRQRSLKENASPLFHSICQIHYARAEELAHLLEENISKRGHVKVDPRTNTILVQDTQDQLLAIKAIIKRLDIPVQQVLIEARLISIDQDFERQLGINFLIKDSGSILGNKQNKYSLAVARLVDGSQLDIQLAALENNGHGEIISTPSLFTENQQPAFIESGEEIPYQEVSEGGGTAITFKKAVLSLKVTPQILPNNNVLLQLQVNQDRPNNRIVLGVPAISTRQISTNVLVRHGQTIVLGGVYEANQEQAAQRTPFLGKIPLVGWLFKQENVKENKRELLIFVTPRIISLKKNNEGNENKWH